MKIAVALVFAFRAWAQGQSTASDPRTQSERLALFDLSSDPQDLANVYRHNLLAFIYYALPPAAVKQAYTEFLSTVQNARLDQQLGAAGASAAAKAGLTTLASFALESGALTETGDQNEATLHVNADGLMRFLTNRDVVPLCLPNDAACQAGWAKDLDLSATFDGNRFASATVSYAVANPRDVRSPEYRAKWLAWFASNHAALGASGQDLLSYAGKLIAQTYAAAPEQTVSRYDAWREDAEAAMTAAPAAERAPVFAGQLDRLIALMREIDPQFEARLADLDLAYLRYFATRSALGSNVIVKPEWAIQMTLSEPALAPKVINARAVYAASPQGENPGTFTANFGVEVYEAAQNMFRFRDAQAAIEFDRPIGATGSPAALSIGANYQYQPRAGMLLASGGIGAANVHGSLFLVQAGITLSISGSGLKLPIGISWSNRSDMGPGQEVRAHVGFTFDSGALAVLK